jgi:superfamily II DNA or RNA helicase
VKTYGTADLRDGAWHITCEPHVAMALKRVCQGISKHVVGTMTLTNTPERCADLRWFCERYPLTVTPRAALDSGAAQHHDHVVRLSDMVAGHTPPPAIPLAVAPRDYQVQAAAVARMSRQLLLADDVGVGKTCSAIATVVDPEHLPAVIVVPSHLLGQWKAQVQRFAPHLSVYVTPGTKPQALPTILGRGPDVILTSYHRLHGWCEVLADYCRSVVYDEVHELRRPESNKHTAATYLAQASKVTLRLGMSATPIFNYGGEFYWVLQALAPGRLGSRGEFLREWCAGSETDDKAKIRNPEAFGSWLRDQGLMLRRTRQDVGRELPPVTVITQEVDAAREALSAVSADVQALARILLGDGDNFGKLRAAGELDWRLRQATGLAKAPAVAAFVRMLVESGEPVVLLGWHQLVYDAWRSVLEPAGIRVASYTGSESPTQKQAASDAWRAGEIDVLMLSLRSGAGLDGLQERGSVVVFGEMDWSPSVHEQCIGRLNRDGQAKPVLAYYLVSDEGADPVMAEALGLKRHQLDGVRKLKGEAPVVQQGDGEHIKRLAMACLNMKGVA